MTRIFLGLTALLLLTAGSCAGSPIGEEAERVDAKSIFENAYKDVEKPHEEGDHHDDDEPRPYHAEADASADLEATLAAAQTSGKLGLIVMGANWCHDSRGLAGHFESESFKTNIIEPNYELVYIDVGEKDRNFHIAQRFGLDEIVGTPTVFIVTGEGEVLNFDTAPTWRDAASRSREEIEDYFTEYAKR